MDKVLELALELSHKRKGPGAGEDRHHAKKAKTVGASEISAALPSPLDFGSARDRLVRLVQAYRGQRKRSPSLLL